MCMFDGQSCSSTALEGCQVSFDHFFGKPKTILLKNAVSHKKLCISCMNTKTITYNVNPKSR